MDAWNLTNKRAFRFRVNPWRRIRMKAYLRFENQTQFSPIKQIRTND